MSTPKHTPGPWHSVLLSDSNYLIVGGPDKGYPHEICITVDEPADEENDANAALITAVPDLLTACKSMKRLIELQHETGQFTVPPNMDSPEVLQLLAAIAKAEPTE